MPFNYTEELFDELEKINSDVNRAVAYTTDVTQYGKEEYWAVAGERGDCEDYALKKMKLLRDKGFPKEHLNIAVCKLQGQGHAVLIVSFDDDADYVLDNNTDEVIRWGNFRVHWIEISVGGDFNTWKKVGA